jgi:hypothetical protein
MEATPPVPTSSLPDPPKSAPLIELESEESYRRLVRDPEFVEKVQKSLWIAIKRIQERSLDDPFTDPSYVIFLPFKYKSITKIYGIQAIWVPGLIKTYLGKALS